jgi:hypothetical protein
VPPLPGLPSGVPQPPQPQQPPAPVTLPNPPLDRGGFKTSEFTAFAGSAAAMLAAFLVWKGWIAPAHQQEAAAHIANVIAFLGTIAGVVASLYRYLRSRETVKTKVIEAQAEQARAALSNRDPDPSLPGEGYLKD